MIVKLFFADRGGEEESVTDAIKPAVPPKFALPDSTPVPGSMESPSTYRAVDEMGAIDQVSTPVPFAADKVAL